MLTRIFVESFTPVKDYRSLRSSKNLECITKFVYSHGILDSIVPSQPAKTIKSRLLEAIQLCLAHWNYDLNLASPVADFQISQKAVYSNALEMPLFLCEYTYKINFEYILHIVNFFKLHLTQESEITLFDAFEAMDEKERPGPWTFQPRQGSYRIGKHWKGTYCKRNWYMYVD